MRLSQDELLRYSRHLVLPEVGLEGQQKLKSARVLIVGAGGLGSPIALYLAAAGVGTLGLVDFDVVDASNLQRQILHGTPDVGRSKIESARQRIQDINPHVQVEAFGTRLSSENALEILGGFDVVADGSDNFPTRYLVNDACVLLGKPDVYGAIFRFDGQAAVFHAKQGPCYRCLFADPPPPESVPTCAEGGVLGVLPGIIGSIQALEVIKLILGRGETLTGRLLLLEGLTMRFREIAVGKDRDCPVCGTNPTIRELMDYEAFCGASAGSRDPGAAEVAAPALKAELEQAAHTVLLDVREPYEHEIARIEGATLVPLRDLPGRIRELDGRARIVTFCHHGIRSRHAVELLRAAGFASVRSLKGGIDAWSREVNPSVPRY